MSIQLNQIHVGSYYLAGKKCDQLRKVVQITQDEQGRNRIIYVSKSANIPDRSFEPAATLANPALETTFADACCKELNNSDVENLRKKNIILNEE